MMNSWKARNAPGSVFKNTVHSPLETFRKPEVYATAATTNRDLQTAQNQLATEKRLSFKRPTDFLGVASSCFKFFQSSVIILQLLVEHSDIIVPDHWLKGWRSPQIPVCRSHKFVAVCGYTFKRGLVPEPTFSSIYDRFATRVAPMPVILGATPSRHWELVKSLEVYKVATPEIYWQRHNSHLQVPSRTPVGRGLGLWGSYTAAASSARGSSCKRSKITPSFPGVETNKMKLGCGFSGGLRSCLCSTFWF